MIKQFFEFYRTAFLNRDLAWILKVYACPVTFYTESGQPVVFEQDRFRDNTVKLFDMYGKLGVTNIGYDLVSESVISENLTLVSVQWRFADSDDQQIYQCLTRYLVRIVAGKLEIAAVFVVDETTQFNQLISEGKV